MKLFAICGYALGLAYTFVIWATFLVAFFNNNRVLITINDFNEAIPEFFFLPFTMAIMLYGLKQMMQTKEILEE
jgi:hypothetical protein